MAEPAPSMSPLEKLGTSFDGLKDWVLKTWRISMLMTRGAYLVGERRRLFVKLGEEVYYKISKGELMDTELEPLVQQLDRLSKKVEIEEILIRSLRFGKRARKPASEDAR